MSKEGYKLQVVKTIKESMPYGGFKKVSELLKKNGTPFSDSHIRKVLSTMDVWNIDIINAAMEICNNIIDDIEKLKDNGDKLKQKTNQLNK